MKGENTMHQTRKTHNAHNETQRRLNKVLSNGYTSTLYTVPHYDYVEYPIPNYPEYMRVHPSWVNKHTSNSVKGAYKVFSSKEEAEFAKKHHYLNKKSKSSGRHSYYKYVKRVMHKWWRRKGLDEQSYSIKGSHISWQDINW